MSDKGYCGFASKADHDAYYSDPANYAAEIPAMEEYTREAQAERDAAEEAYNREVEARMSDDLVERVARAMARNQGDDFDQLPMGKSEWTASRGYVGGRYRTINEPMKSDYLDMAEAAIKAIEAAGYVVVPREQTERYERALEQCAAYCVIPPEGFTEVGKYITKELSRRIRLANDALSLTEVVPDDKKTL